jgi:hypothetical protein
VFFGSLFDFEGLMASETPEKLNFEHRIRLENSQQFKNEVTN